MQPRSIWQSSSGHTQLWQLHSATSVQPDSSSASSIHSAIAVSSSGSHAGPVVVGSSVGSDVGLSVVDPLVLVADELASPVVVELVLAVDVALVASVPDELSLPPPSSPHAARSKPTEPRMQMTRRPMQTSLGAVRGPIQARRRRTNCLGKLRRQSCATSG